MSPIAGSLVLTSPFWVGGDPRYIRKFLAFLILMATIIYFLYVYLLIGTIPLFYGGELNIVPRPKSSMMENRILNGEKILRRQIEYCLRPKSSTKEN